MTTKPTGTVTRLISDIEDSTFRLAELGADRYTRDSRFPPLRTARKRPGAFRLKALVLSVARESFSVSATRCGARRYVC
jgi:hypothetical protein